MTMTTDSSKSKPPSNWPFPTYKGVLLQQDKKRDTLNHIPDFDKLSDKVGDTNAEDEALF
jgi:hypothetical protein